MPKFEIKKYHKNMGHEGEGFWCELWMDGLLVAHVIDEGNGGSPLYQWTNREAREKVHAHIATLPPKHYTLPGVTPWDTKADEETFICDLVEAHKMQKACKTKTIFRLKEDELAYYEMKVRFSPEVAEGLRKKYGDKLLEIVNESLQ